MKKLLLTSLFTIYYLLSAGSAFAQSVDILWQGKGYVAPFYQGRTLWAKQGQITFFAVAQGLGNPSSLNYKWTRNGTILGTSSGVGKSSLTFNDTIFSKPVAVKVEIINASNDVSAEASTVLVPVPQYISVYESNPLYGTMFHREIPTTFRMEEAEVAFAAFPFFFNALGRSDASLIYKWGGDVGESVITYRSPEDTSGTAKVSVSLTHASDFIQSASRSFLVEFGNENNN